MARRKGMWAFLPDHPVKGLEAIVVGKHVCPSCNGILERLARRDLMPPYRWNVCGYVCSLCNSVSLEYGRLDV